MITITVKGLAKFMTGTHAAQRKTVHEFKYPKENESAAQQKYYREARRFIKAHHEQHRSQGWLTQKATSLQLIAKAEHGSRRTRLQNNARALRAYDENFADKNYEVLEDLTLVLEIGPVNVKVTPDLHVRENGQEQLIKLEFSKKVPDDRHSKIISQVMYEAALANNLMLPSNSILFRDVPRGVTHKGARAGARANRELAAACQTISDIWQTI